MPLLTPKSSTSSRQDDVLIMRPIGVPSHGDSPGHSSHLMAQGSRMKDRILILGPFMPQSLTLSSSESNDSHPQRTFSPIPVPYPSYEDCFAAPPPPGSDIFDQLAYESSVIDASPPSLSQPVSGWSPWVDEENEHRQTVKTRLEAMDHLMSSVIYDSPESPQGRSPGYQVSKSTTPDRVWEPLIVRSKTHKPPAGNDAPACQRRAYQIPQLRDLLICDDLPAEVDSQCHACHALASARSMKKVIPCHDVICGRCFSAALGAVSEGHPMSRCPACLRPMTAFTKLDHRTKHSILPGTPSRRQEGEMLVRPEADGLIVMRIDNVAWDLTPEVVRQFLPKGTLADVPVPIHIPLDRYDGRTKDYMYIEVASREAARTILQTCQNAPMLGGPLSTPRRRAVTITQVHHSELLKELRPHSASELQALLSLCQASVSDIRPPSNHTSSYVAPNGIAHFVKNRHGPFNALMSILSKVKGKESPVYWDLFHITSGTTIQRTPQSAIAALASHISQSSDPAIETQESDLDPDRMVLKRLTGMFESVFGIKLESGRLSPV